MMETAVLISAFVTLFVVIDPIGLSPLFVALTTGMSSEQRRSIAIRACCVAIAILLAFGLFGEALLGFVGISMAAFKIAGGVLLFITALDMLFERRQARREDTADEDTPTDDPSVFPLALPLIAGPGSIATMILLGSNDWAGYLSVSLVMISVIALVFILFLAASLFERILGKTGINIVTRLLGMLLAALSVQFVLDGLREFGIGGV